MDQATPELRIPIFSQHHSTQTHYNITTLTNALQHHKYSCAYLSKSKGSTGVDVDLTILFTKKFFNMILAMSPKAKYNLLLNNHGILLIRRRVHHSAVLKAKDPNVRSKSRGRVFCLLWPWILHTQPTIHTYARGTHAVYMPSWNGLDSATDQNIYIRCV